MAPRRHELRIGDPQTGFYGLREACSKSAPLNNIIQPVSSASKGAVCIYLFVKVQRLLHSANLEVQSGHPHSKASQAVFSLVRLFGQENYPQGNNLLLLLNGKCCTWHFTYILFELAHQIVEDRVRRRRLIEYIVKRNMIFIWFKRTCP